MSRLPFKLEVGGEYVTRNGTLVVVNLIGSGVFPVRASSIYPGETYTYTLEGTYHTSASSVLDIVAQAFEPFNFQTAIKPFLDNDKLLDQAIEALTAHKAELSKTPLHRANEAVIADYRRSGGELQYRRTDRDQITWHRSNTRCANPESPKLQYRLKPEPIARYVAIPKAANSSSMVFSFTSLYTNAESALTGKPGAFLLTLTFDPDNDKLLDCVVSRPQVADTSQPSTQT